MDLKSDLKKIIIVALSMSMLLIIIYFLFLKEDFVKLLLGQIFGFLISVLNFIDLYFTMNRAVTKSPSKANNYAIRKYFMRYIIVGVVLYVAAITPHISIVSTAIGLISMKFSVIIIYALFGTKKKEIVDIDQK